MLQGFGLLLAPIAVAIAVAAFLHSRKHPEDQNGMHLAMGLLAGGALGNLWDRLAYQKVTDMFWFRAIDFPVFNVADSCITVAAVILVLHWASEIVPRRKKRESVQESAHEIAQGPGSETSATDAP